MPTNDDTLAGETLDAVRAELARRRYSLIDLAPVLHVSRSTLYRRFEGAEPIDPGDLELIAGFLRIEVRDILDSARFGRRIAERERGSGEASGGAEGTMTRQERRDVSVACAGPASERGAPQ